MTDFLNAYFKYVGIFLDTMWIWMPFVLAVAFFQSWMYYIRRVWWRKLDWVILEVRPPRQIERTPKTMEQIFAGLWGSFGTVSTKYQKYFLGTMQDYFSFELVSKGGEIHFYLRGLRKYRNLIEAQVYSQYPQAEIKEVPDYADEITRDIPSKNWDLWGAKLKLDREDYYPIRTYLQMLDLVKSDEPFIDPLSGLMEVFGSLRPGENIWIQIVFRAIPDDWRDKSHVLANKLFGRKPLAKAEGLIQKDIRTWVESIGAVTHELITDTLAPPSTKKEEKDQELSVMKLTPGERDVIAGIEEKASKKGFECKIQWAYIARKDIFAIGNVPAVMGIFSQFASLNMNSLRPIPKTVTSRAYYFLVEQRKAYKKRLMMRWLRTRSFWEKGYVLNIEELASLYHFPTVGVTAPMTPYIEVKKSGPPVDLPRE
jgi:hypothetical protein